MTDNIFDSDCQAIINTINCVGNMGGGLAKQFRLRYPEMNEAYQHACAQGRVVTGKMWNWWESKEQRWLINFPTKDDWRNPSELSYVEEGLKDLRRVIADLKLKSIAIPPLGCGLGGLRWDDVLPLIEKYLGDLNGVRVEIYPPDGTKYDLHRETTMPSKYYYAPGMLYPFWAVRQESDYPHKGEQTVIAHNLSADTDQGDLEGDEFHEIFPGAIEISREDALNRVHPK